MTEKNVSPRLTRAALPLSLILLLPSCGENGPAEPATLPISWTFDLGLDGWAPGGVASGYPFGAVSHSDGQVVLQGAGDPGTPNVWISRSVDLPAGANVFLVRAISRCVSSDPSDTNVRVRVEQGGTSTIALDWTEVGIDWRTLAVPIMPYAGEAVRFIIELDDNGEQEEDPTEAESLCIDEITIAEVS